jgi:hypothetical protein
MHPFDQHEVRRLDQIVTVEEVPHRLQRRLRGEDAYEAYRKPHN